MFPQRFAESACLRLPPRRDRTGTQRALPRGPPPKVVHGYQLAQDYGCYGCHEINGYDGPDRTHRPATCDWNLITSPLRPRSKRTPALPTSPRQVQYWAETLIEQPDRDYLRHKLSEFLTADADSDAPQLGDSHCTRWSKYCKTRRLPGPMRRAWPSLRYVQNKWARNF